ncbi:unnamed protein product [Ixodes pacificus]
MSLSCSSWSSRAEDLHQVTYLGHRGLKMCTELPISSSAEQEQHCLGPDMNSRSEQGCCWLGLGTDEGCLPGFDLDSCCFLFLGLCEVCLMQSMDESFQLDLGISWVCS